MWMNEDGGGGGSESIREAHNNHMKIPTACSYVLVLTFITQT